ncbi:MAG: ABC-type multidrug transport system, ATPase and permease component, partial [Microbacterium sp.]|nr:ABC-type multidrug transport system, ATPase and permease component [Microbacterium sp.]
MTTVTGTGGEDRSDYTREESRHIRRRSLRLLGSLVSPLRGHLILAALVLVVSTALRVIGPALIAYGIDTALPAVIDRMDWMPAIGVFAVYLVSALGGAALIGLDTIRELLDGGLNELVSGVLFGGFTLVALVLLDWQSGVVLVVMGVPLWLLMRWFYRRSQLVYRESRVVSAKVIVQFVETMTGIRAVKAFRKEPRNDEAFGELSGQYRDVNMRSIKLFGTFEPALMAISAATLAIVILWGGLRVSTGALEVGVLLAGVLYVRNFFSPLQEVAMFLNSYQSAAAALEKVSGVLEEEPSVPDPVDPEELRSARGGIRFEDVEFGYGGGRVVLPGFSLDVPAGQTIALVGTTGAGKTTLAKLVSRFYDPTAGRVTLDGVDLRRLHPKDLRR